MYYAYRKMTPLERQQVLAYRRLVHFPLHEPPHFERDSNLYFLTAANFEHRHILRAASRRIEYERKLLEMMAGLPGAEVFGWCILPNHMHVLARVDLTLFGRRIGRLHNGTSTQWNREDATPGRAVWFRYTDRGIRSEAHFFAALNYLHFNPVKHGHAASMELWETSSVHVYLEQYGLDRLNELAAAYPILDFGKGWDC
ncbi:MAG: transposase [Armatimonadota bacterium]